MNDVWFWLKHVAAGAGGVVIAQAAGLPPTVWLLLGLMAFDILSGVIAGSRAGQLSSSISFGGMRKKAGTILLLAAIYFVQRYVDFPVDLAAAAAGFYALHELLSILENVVRAGVEVPPWLRDSLARVSPANGKPDRETPSHLNPSP